MKVESEYRDSVVILRLSAPNRGNAIGPAIREGVLSRLSAAATDPKVRAVVLTAEGSVFSSGGDFVDDFGPVLRNERTAGELIQEHFAFFDAIRDFPKPVVAGVNGHARGGGAELVLACDLAVASPQATLGFPEPRTLGTPAGFALASLPRRLPDKVIAELLMLGEPIAADEALRLGLINKVASSADCVVDEAVRLAEALAQRAPLALALIKRTLRATHDLQLGESMIEEIVRLFDSEDVAGAIQAFVEKQTPTFRGR